MNILKLSATFKCNDYFPSRTLATFRKKNIQNNTKVTVNPDDDDSTISKTIQEFVANAAKTAQSESRKVPLFKQPSDFSLFQFEVSLKKIQNNRKLVVRSATKYSPFDVYNYKVERLSTYGSQKQKVDRRLSVTLLLVDRWCELRTYYAIYARYKQKYTKAMKVGTRVHETLELLTHPNVDITIISELYAAVTKEDRYAIELSKNISRLACLFRGGSAREIKVHAFVNTKSKKFIDSNKEAFNLEHSKLLDSDHIVVSGVIDGLHFKNRTESFEEDGNFNISMNDQVIDFDSLLEFVETNKESFYKNNLVISDVKSRHNNTLPVQESVIQSAVKQVCIYQKMLECLTISQNLTLAILTNVTKRYELNLDEPIHPMVALRLMLEDRFFIYDFKKLMDGEYFADLKAKSNCQNKEDAYNFASIIEFIHEKLENSSELEKKNQKYSFEIFKEILKIFTKTGKIKNYHFQTPITLRYFLDRYSKALMGLQDTFSNKVSVEYYSTWKHMKFAEVLQEYSKVKTESLIEDSMKFWLGERDPRPFEPTFRNFNMKCGFCEFRDVCDYKKHYFEREKP